MMMMNNNKFIIKIFFISNLKIFHPKAMIKKQMRPKVVKMKNVKKRNSIQIFIKRKGSNIIT
jgi:hypothetical protein